MSWVSECFKMVKETAISLLQGPKVLKVIVEHFIIPDKTSQDLASSSQYKLLSFPHFVPAKTVFLLLFFKLFRLPHSSGPLYMLLPLYGEFLSRSVRWLVLSCPVTSSERPFLIAQHVFALYPIGPFSLSCLLTSHLCHSEIILFACFLGLHTSNTQMWAPWCHCCKPLMSTLPGTWEELSRQSLDA